MSATESELAACPILKGLNPEYVALLAKGAEKKSFAPGEVLVRQGDPANRLFLLQEGTVVLEWHRSGQTNVPVHVAGAGEAVGWSWLFPPFVSHFQARVTEPVTAYVLNAGSLLAACEKNCRFGFELMNRLARVVIERLQSARKQVVTAKRAMPQARQTATNDRPPAFETGPLKDLLVEHPFLAGMSPHHLQKLSDCAMEVEFDKGETVFRAGDLANRFYLVLEGQIALESRENGSRHSIQTLGPGEVLGWSWLYEPYVWRFDARTLERTRAIFIYGTRLRELCETDPCFGFDLLKRVSRVVIRRLEAVCENLAS